MTANDNGNEVLRKVAEPVHPQINPGPYYFKIKDILRSPFDRDAFERFRVSTPTDIFDHKNVYDIDEFQFKQLISGTATITHNQLESCANLTIGTAEGDRAVRQSRHLPYTPGKSQFLNMTGVWGLNQQDGTVRRFGYFDDLNGLFIEINGSEVFAVVRSDTSGTVVDTRYPRSTWDDPLDGTGDSGITIDFTRTQIFVMDFQWLGVGKVRMGFNIDGLSVLAKEINHANIIEQVYMRTASLPLRVEIFNSQAVAAPTTLKEICMTLSSEALTDPVGLIWHVGNLGALRSIGVTLTPFIAVRLRNTFKTQVNRFTALLKSTSYYTATESTYFVVSKVYNPTSVTGTFTSVNDESAMEVSTDITAYTADVEEVISCEVVPGASQGSRIIPGSGQNEFSFLSEASLITQNYDSTNSDMFVIRAATLNATSNCFGSFTWLEVA